jgi:hypothetical protein
MEWSEASSIHEPVYDINQFMSLFASESPIADVQAAKRLRFLALHLHDLQSLRWLGLECACILMPFLSLLTERQARVACAILVAFTVCWFAVFCRWVRSHFGRTRLSAAERMRQRYPTQWIALLIGLFLVGHLIWRVRFHSNGSDWYLNMIIVVWLLSRVLDTTNLPERRIAYATALAGTLLTYLLLVKTSSLPDGNWLQYVPISAFGVILLVLSLFDLYLLQSTVARFNAASVPSMMGS